VLASALFQMIFMGFAADATAARDEALAAANRALEISRFGYVLETGKIVLQGSSDSLRQDPKVKNAYLGGS